MDCYLCTSKWTWNLVQFFENPANFQNVGYLSKFCRFAEICRCVDILSICPHFVDLSKFLRFFKILSISSDLVDFSKNPVHIRLKAMNNTQFIALCLLNLTRNERKKNTAEIIHSLPLYRIIL